jgi:hypothetical protein
MTSPRLLSGLQSAACKIGVLMAHVAYLPRVYLDGSYRKGGARCFEAHLLVSDAVAAAHPGFLVPGQPKYMGVYDTDEGAAQVLDRMLIKLLGDGITSDMLNVRNTLLCQPGVTISIPVRINSRQ